MRVETDRMFAHWHGNIDKNKEKLSRILSSVAYINSLNGSCIDGRSQVRDTRRTVFDKVDLSEGWKKSIIDATKRLSVD